MSLLLKQVAGSRNGSETGKPPEETRGITGLKQVTREKRVFSQSHLRERDSHTHAYVGEDPVSHGVTNIPVSPVSPVSDQQLRGFERNRLESQPVLPVSPPAFGPVPGSLQARLVAVGATVNTYGKRASVRAPAGIPLELVREVEARGWAIIPGGRPNDEAEHDTWLAGVPIAELER